MIFRLDPAGATVAVEAHPGELARAVARLFAPLRVDDERGPAPVLAVGRDGDGYALVALDGGRGGGRFGTVPELLGAAEHAILTRLLGSLSPVVLLHGAGLGTAGGAVVALGASGAGKSSLALAWSLAGRPILSDDVLAVDAAARVFGVPRLVKVHRDRLAAVGLAPHDTVAHDPADPEVWVDPGARGGWSRDGLPAVALLSVRFDGGPGTRVVRLGEAAALRLLLDHVLEGGLPPEGGFDRLAGLAARAPAWSVRFGDAEDAVRVIARLTGEDA